MTRPVKMVLMPRSELDRALRRDPVSDRALESVRILALMVAGRRRGWGCSIDSEDVAQQAVLKVINGGLKSYREDEKGNPYAWVRTVARRVAIDLARRKRNVHTYDHIAEAHAILNDRSITPPTDHELQFYKEMCNRLSEDERSVIDLHTRGMTLSMVASFCGIPYGTVYARYRNGLVKLRRLAEKGDPSAGPSSTEGLR